MPGLPRLALIALAILATSSAAGGAFVLLTDAPKPPTADPAATAAIPDLKADKPALPVETAFVKPPVTVPGAKVTEPDASDEAGFQTFRTGLDALTADDLDTAMDARDSLPPGDLRDALSFSIAVSGLPGVTLDEIQTTRKALAAWPGLDELRRNEEHAIFVSPPSPETVIAHFGTTEPETVEGKVALALAFKQAGRPNDAHRLMSTLLATDPLYPAIETRILADFGDLLTRDDHRRHMVRLLFAEQNARASLFAVKAGAEALHTAFIAGTTPSGNAEKAFKAAEATFKDEPALLYAKAKYFRLKRNYKDAARLLEQAPKDASALVVPADWWAEARIVSRNLAEAGKAKAAYALAVKPWPLTDADRVEAEFHAGWYALRRLKDPGLAEPHFAAILKVSDRPVALARGFYWLGRTEELRDKELAAGYFQRAATFTGTFYGQLAAAKLGTETLRFTEPGATAADEAAFNRRPEIRAALLYEKAGHPRRAIRIIRAAAGAYAKTADFVLLSRLAARVGGPAVALETGKTIYGRGFNLPTLAWPVGAIPDTADIEGSGKALAYAVARQESAFNPRAVSPANAFGLLQLLPETAKRVAGRHGMDFKLAALLDDPGYNATLGAHYLGEQIDAYDGSYILTLAAYNAGPKRVNEWLKRYGDPRGRPINDIVDWIERIPFSETRAYVHRVMENYQVYKARLGETANLEKDLTGGRRR